MLYTRPKINKRLRRATRLPPVFPIYIVYNNLLHRFIITVTYIKRVQVENKSEFESVPLYIYHNMMCYYDDGARRASSVSDFVVKLTNVIVSGQPPPLLYLFLNRFFLSFCDL